MFLCSCSQCFWHFSWNEEKTCHVNICKMTMNKIFCLFSFADVWNRKKNGKLREAHSASLIIVKINEISLGNQFYSKFVMRTIFILWKFPCKLKLIPMQISIFNNFFRSTFIVIVENGNVVIIFHVKNSNGNPIIIVRVCHRISINFYFSNILLKY